jgi:enoyl-CoA hydratase/carnithine racemase
MTYDTILTVHNERVLTVTLNRPHKLNAWTFQMGAEMRDAILVANQDDNIDAIIVTGAGRGFCAGADIEDVFKAQTQATPAYAEEAATDDWVRLVRTSKPIVAAINGVAIGVGLSQILPMDRLVAARGARLSLRFVKMGVVPELASSHFLAARIGFGAASDLMLTGRTLEADEALAMRLVDAVTEPQDLLTAAHAAARAMGENPHAAVAETKALLTANMADDSLTRIQEREMAALNRSYASPEHHEAVAAFMEKRAPEFEQARRK